MDDCAGPSSFPELPLPALGGHVGRDPRSHLDSPGRTRHRLFGDRLRDPRRPIEPDHPLGDAVNTFLLREDAERFIEEVRGNDPELAGYLRLEERELEVGGPN